MNTSSNILLQGNFTRFVSPGSGIIVVEHDDALSDSRKMEEVRRNATEEADRKWQGRLAEESAKNARLWATLDSEFSEFMKQVESQISKQLVDLSVKMAEIILRRELPDQNMIRQLIREVIEPISDLHGAKIRLNAKDLEVLTKARQESGKMDASARLELVPDNALAPGDVMIESKNGYFDARISERLKVLQEKLMERARQGDQYCPTV